LDVYSFPLLLGNALSRPRAVSERLMNILVNDGLISFLTILDKIRVACFSRTTILMHFSAWRLTGIILITTTPASFWPYGTLGVGSAIATAVISRLFLELQERRTSQERNEQKEHHYGFSTNDDCDTELQERRTNA